MNWERNEINGLRSKLDSFFEFNGLVFSSEEENSRDGGYVSYKNKSGKIVIYVFFLPNYEMEIHYNDSSFINLFKKESKEIKSISLKKELKIDTVSNLDSFLSDCQKHIVKANLLKKTVV